MKSILLLISVTSLLAFAGCDDDSSGDLKQSIEKALKSHSNNINQYEQAFSEGYDEILKCSFEEDDGTKRLLVVSVQQKTIAELKVTSSVSGKEVYLSDFEIFEGGYSTKLAGFFKTHIIERKDGVYDLSMSELTINMYDDTVFYFEEGMPLATSYEIFCF